MSDLRSLLAPDRALARKEALFKWTCRIAIAIPLLMLAILLSRVVADGAGRIDGDFLSNGPSRRASSRSTAEAARLAYARSPEVIITSETRKTASRMLPMSWRSLAIDSGAMKLRSNVSRSGKSAVVMKR